MENGWYGRNSPYKTRKLDQSVTHSPAQREVGGIKHAMDLKRHQDWIGASTIGRPYCGGTAPSQQISTGGISIH